MLSAAEMESIQQDAVNAACDKTCAIYRKTTTPGSTGEPLATWTLIETTVAGMVEPSAGDLQNFDFRIGDKVAWKLRLPVGTNVLEQDHAVVDGEVMEVQVILDPRSYAAFRSVLVSEVK